MAESERSTLSTPSDVALTTPDISSGAGPLRLVIGQLDSAIGEIRSDIGNIKDHRHTDFKWLVTIFGLGFVALATMFIVGYMRLEDRLDPLSISNTKIETKLDDLLARIPPAITPVPKR